MTQRTKALVVILESPMREDDAQSVAEAIGMIKGVFHVSQVEENVDDQVNREMVRLDMINRLLEILKSGP